MTALEEPVAEPHSEIVLILALDPPSQPERSLHMCPMWLVVCCVPQVCCGPSSVPMTGSGKGTYIVAPEVVAGVFVVTRGSLQCVALATATPQPHEWPG